MVVRNHSNRIYPYFIAILSILFSIVFFNPPSASAQTYLFTVEKEIVNVFWESDGTITIFYDITFANSSQASPIDFVDVGIPTSSYILADVSASINRREITHILYSPYLDEGVELGLGSNAIGPGQKGQLHVEIYNVSNVLYTDDDDDNYASAVFSPSWFGSEFVLGTTDLAVIYHMPPGVKINQPKYHQAPLGFPLEPEIGFDGDGRVTYKWRNIAANGYTQYLFGASFPSSAVPKAAVQTPSFWQRIGIDAETFFAFSVTCGFILFIVGIPILSIISTKRRKLKYFPPKITASGHGIKRGLTAIEAAILLEEPMDKVLTMILFAVIKKGAAVVEKQKPLKLKITDPIPEKLRPYEKKFLQAMLKERKSSQKKAIKDSMVNLIKSVSRKMKGFSKRDTTKYYKSIIKKAWNQVESADTPEVLIEKFDEVMEWTMLDKNYDDRTRDVFQNRPVYLPHWWHRYDPGYTTPTAPKSTYTGRAGRASSAGGGSLPNIPGSDFAASVVTGAQEMAAGVIGSVESFTSGITKVTNPPPVSTSSGGGGGGSSCACACAGCACACAGGGR